MSTPQSSLESEFVRITLTLDIPVGEILDPDRRFAPDAVIPPEVQARIDREKLATLPDTDEELLRRIEQIFAIRDAVHLANLRALCRGALAWRLERPV